MSKATPFVRSWPAGFDGRFDVGPLFSNDVLAAFDRPIECRARFFGFLDQVFFRLPGIGFQLSPRLFSGLRREKNPGESAGCGSSEKSEEQGLSGAPTMLVVHA